MYDDFDMTNFFLLNKKPKGDLEDCLELYSDIQLEYILLNYIDNIDNIPEDKTEKISIIKQNIFDNFASVMKRFSVDDLRSLKEYNNKEELNLDAIMELGMAFKYKDKTCEKYYIPKDILKLFKEKINDELLNESEKYNFYIFASALGVACGPVTYDEIYEIYSLSNSVINKDNLLESLDKSFNKWEINKQFYYLNNEIDVDIKVIEDYLTILISKDYCFVDYIKYASLAMDCIEDIFTVSDIAKSELFENLLVKPITNKKLINKWSKKYNLSALEKEEITTILDKLDNRRYWIYRGRTQEEKDMLLFVLNKRPKQVTLENCLKELNKDALDMLYKKYHVANITDLVESIKNKLVDYTLEEGKLFFIKDNEEIKDYFSECITLGFCFIYNNLIVVPDEIIEWQETLDNFIDYLPKLLIREYMISYGIVKKKVLQDILLEYHDIDLEEKEFDKIIEDMGFIVKNDYYEVASVLEEIVDIFDEIDRDYKILDNQEISAFLLDNYLADDLEKVLENSGLASLEIRELIGNIIALMHLANANEDYLDDFASDKGLNIDQKLKNKIMKVVDKYKDDFPIWFYGGYSEKEMDEM